MTKNPLALEKPNKHGPFYGYQRDGAGRFTCPKLGRVRTNFQAQLWVAASGFRGAKLNAWDVQHTREPPPTEGRPSPSAHSLHPRRQARNLARSGVLVDHAPGDAAHDFRLRSLQRSRSSRFIAGGDGFLDLAHIGADARAAR